MLKRCIHNISFTDFDRLRGETLIFGQNERRQLGSDVVSMLMASQKGQDPLRIVTLLAYFRYCYSANSMAFRSRLA
jgi:hypothetical protein